MATKPRLNIDEEVIRKTVLKFNKEENTSGVISPKEVFEYANRLYEEGIFPYKLTYDFWKRKERIGRTIIDEVNEIRKEKCKVSEGEGYDVVDVKDLLNKYGKGGKEQLEKYLIPMEKQIRSLIEEKNKKEKEIKENKKEKEELKEELRKEKEKSEKLQELLIQLFVYGKSGATLDNLMNTGNTRTERVERALENAFVDPTDFLEKIKEKEEKREECDNVVQLNIENDWDL